MTRYINEHGETYNGKFVVVDGIKYISPSANKLAELGYHVVVDEPQVYEPTTEELTRPYKDALAAEDYKVIKCMEAFLRGLPLPYDINVLGEARDAIRDEINALEEGGAEP